MSHLQKEEMENTPIHSQEKCKEADSGTVVIILFFLRHGHMMTFPSIIMYGK